jgi:hypothetical protein
MGAVAAVLSLISFAFLTIATLRAQSDAVAALGPFALGSAVGGAALALWVQVIFS